MASFTNSETLRPSILQSIASFFRSIGQSFDFAASANARIAQMDKLNALSDAELAEKGLRREDIARYVFRDILYM